MVVGTDAGLTLLGVWAPVSTGRVGEAHGLLMVLGFVGTLIALERAVALGASWAYAAPTSLGSGALLLLVPGADRLGHLLLVAGTATLCAVYVPLWRRQRDDAVLVSGLGAVLALGSTVLVLDEIPLGALLDTSGAIDADRYPNFARLADLSTWYPKAETVATWTSLPSSAWSAVEIIS